MMFRRSQICRMRSWSSYCITFIVVCLMVGASATCADGSSVVNEPTEYCQEETFSARCEQPNEVVLMTSARYGRLHLGRCVKRNLGYLGCAVDALSVVDAKCSGLPGAGCDLSIMDPALRELKPCPKDVTWHLEASFQCVEVLFGSVHECHTHRHASGSAPSGYLASAVAARTQVGSASCPWQLVAAPGQRVNVTLFSFISSSSSSASSSDSSVHLSDGIGGRSAGPEVCYDVASVRDGARSPRMITACSGEQRQRQVFVSESNTVQLEFIVRTSPQHQQQLSGAQGGPSSSSSMIQTPQFLVHYQFIGCPTVASPPGATASRDGDITSIRCNATGETWYLHCTGTKWTGLVGNCSSHSGQTSWTADELFGQSSSFPFGILIVVAVGVALGVFLGGTMLLLASMFMKRRHRRQGLGRPDGSDNVKSMCDLHETGDQFDYPVSGSDQMRTKHYVMPDYSMRKEYVIGTTSDVLASLQGYETTPGTAATPSGLLNEYPTESRCIDRMMQHPRGAQPGNASTLAMHAPRIHYHHVYESPHFT